MIESQPSRTAQGAAMHRAAHQLLDSPLVLADPFAMAIIGEAAAETLRNGEDRHAQARAIGMRALIVARSRFAEDCFAGAYAHGVRQYVVLGAGLDTFAYRSPFSEARVFEIDHPATQRWKQARLAETGIAVPASTTYTPVDFESETIVEGLQRVAFDFAQPAFFAWLGVTPYLTPDTIMGTLGIIARTTKAGSEVVFDFSVPAGDDPQAQARKAAFAARVAEIGEPLKSTFVPAVLAHDVRALGFSTVEIADRTVLNARYFRDRSDGLTLRGGHLMRARV
jgi:methyltransferase (TIGR00027 family)